METPSKRLKMATPDKSLEMEPGPTGDDEDVPDQPELTKPTFYHFKIKYDPSWDYPEICKTFFLEDYPYLAVLESTVNVEAHVHYQGTSLMAERTVKNKITALVKKHFLRKFGKGCRPSSMSCRKPDEVGFQYMAKQVTKGLENVLARNKFTDEEIMELKAKSDEYVKTLKFETKKFITELLDEKAAKHPGQKLKEPENCYNVLKKAVIKKLFEAGKAPNRYTDKDVLEAFFLHPAGTDETRSWCYDRMKR